jgi:hypothetical protein
MVDEPDFQEDIPGRIAPLVVWISLSSKKRRIHQRDSFLFFQPKLIEQGIALWLPDLNNQYISMLVV